MFKKFSSKELIFTAMIGVLAYLVDLMIATGISTTTGISGLGGVFSTFFFIAIMTIGGMTIKKFGFFTGASLIYGALYALTPVSIMPPFAMLVLPIIVGILIDALLLAFNYSAFSYYIVLPIGNALSIPLGFMTYKLLGLNAAAGKLAPYVIIFIALYLIISLAGVWAGLRIYNKKLKNNRLIKQIRG